MKLRKLLAATTLLAGASMVPGHTAIVDNPHFKVLGLVIVWGADDYAGTGTSSPVVSDFILDTFDDGTNGDGTEAGSSDVDLISGDVHTVVTGSLTPTSDADASASAFDVIEAGSSFASVTAATTGFNAFDLTDTTTIAAEGAQIESSFFVASNVGFGIDADADVVGTAVNFELADIGFEMDVTVAGSVDNGGTPFAFGGDAQLPVASGDVADGLQGVTTLADIEAASPVFRADQRTAATPGSIADQSVRFDVTYTLGGTDGYDLSMGAGEIETNVTYRVYVP